MPYSDLLAPINAFLKAPTPDAWVEKARQSENLAVILKDHLICELKAGQSAMYLLRKYVISEEDGKALLDWMQPYEDFAYRGEGDLSKLKQANRFSKQLKPREELAKNGMNYGQEFIDKMVLLIKEELHHFYQVLEIMQSRNIEIVPLTASRYAKELMRHARTYEPATLVDKLIIGAFIEARSCERFAKLAPYLEADLNKFYTSLLRSEARHYQDYLALAQSVIESCDTDNAKTKKGGQISLGERIDYFANLEAKLITSDDGDFKFHSGKPIA